jgi:retron-type reverse transcriptase
MSEQTRSYQEIWEIINQMGREEFILQEMIRYGFWPAEEALPKMPEDEAKRRQELQQELQQLYQERKILNNENALKKKFLKERLEESKRKQQETKERREQERLARKEAWQQQKEQDLVYLGEDVSEGLNYQNSDLDKLNSLGLPLLEDGRQIANAMGISLGQLRFLAFNRKVSPISHYIRFKIPKKTGGERLISAPLPKLKQAQNWILKNILEKLTIHDAVHGFCQGKSIVTNAEPHVGAKLIINLDLKEFFPSFNYRRVKGLFTSLGYSEAVATVFGLLCTEAELETVELDQKIYYVALGDRFLPQGSPASPAITNLICRRLDRRLETLATRLGFTYTRYADDLTFSTSQDQPPIAKILRNIESIVNHEGLTINQEKTRILRASSQQEVTGIVVNDKLGLDRKTLKKFRALLFQIERDGLVGKSWGNSPDLIASLEGYTNFVAMVSPEKAAKFKTQIKKIKRLHQS